MTIVQNIKFICLLCLSKQSYSMHGTLQYTTQKLIRYGLTEKQVQSVPSPSLSRNRLASRCGSNL